MNTSDYRFCLEFSVRDYECDLQGIVNNAVYQHYYEHTRHEFLKTTGDDFARLHDDGIDPVVTHAEIDYLLPLKSSDRFIVCLTVEKKGRLRIVFCEDIFRLPDNTAISRSLFEAAFLKQGRPVKSDVIKNLFPKEQGE